MTTVSIKKEVPDGGYGWVIAGAYALHHLAVIPILQGFGLIYKDTFHDLKFTATEIGLILNTCSAFSMVCGIIASPLLKHFGYRKVAFIGACFLTIGVLLTAQSTTFVHFMITYGFITSLGMGLGLSSYPVALNSYFIKKRSKASGYTMTIAGLGPVIMPQVMSFLLSIYGVRGATILLGGISAHTFISSSLLQPVERHMREAIELNEEEGQAENSKRFLEVPEETNFDTANRRNISRQISKEIEMEAMYNMESDFSQSMMSIAERFQRQVSTLSTRTQLSEVKIKLYDEDGNIIEEAEHMGNFELEEEDESENVEKTSVFGKICKYIVDMFDLSLLKDPIYVNIMVGMSLAVFAEINFSVLIPFIMGDYNFSTQQIATFMSVISCTDICFRFLAPYISDCLNQPHRVLYMLTLLLLIITRFSLLMTSNYYPLLIVAAGIGIAKGLRTVYSILVIPSHVPIERLAAALCIQMAVNGVFIWIGGPAIGFIRDITGSYVRCIYVINGVTFSGFLMWSVEMWYMKFKKGT